jgi:hypothetical protein
MSKITLVSAVEPIAFSLQARDPDNAGLHRIANGANVQISGWPGESDGFAAHQGATFSTKVAVAE